MVADVVGYYGWIAGSSGGLFRPLTPSRLLDSRNGTGGFTEPVGPAASIDVDVAGVNGVPRYATAAVLNVTATEPTTAGFLTVYPPLDERPLASNLNFVPNQTVPNLVVASLGDATGKMRIYNNAGTTHVVADVVGYFVWSG